MARDITGNLFFVIGSPRSGTTLMQSMLARAPGVTIPPETAFMGITWVRRARLGRIGSDRGWAAAVNAVVERSERYGFPVDPEELRAELSSAGERSYARLLNDWLALCADAAGADVVGEKSPLHTEHAGRLASMFPGARFVQMVRDPRDVALSQTSIWERTALQSAWRWRVDQKLAIEHGRAIGADRFRVQRYEDLVADPEGSLRAISSFLSIPYDGAMLDPSSREGSGFAAHETHKLQTLERVSTGRIGRYKGRLAARDIGVVQAVCAPLMTHFGYGLEPIPRWRGLCGAALQVVPTLLGRFRASRRKRDRLDRAADIAP